MPEKKPIFKKKNVLIAGGAGFIGSHICDELIKDAKVICVDNFSTGNIENISHLLQYPDFKFIKHDITKPLDLNKFPELGPFKVKFQGIQEIYNAACPTSPKDYNAYPVETLLANSLGVKNLLDVAVEHQAILLHLSTSSVYGEPNEGEAFPEEYWGFIDPIGPRSCYNEGKRFAESLVVNYRNTYDIDAKIARVFNTYGPRMKLTDGRMIPDFINQALDNQTITVHGVPDAESTFLYISDLVEGLMKFAKSSENGPLNFGNPEVHRVVDVGQKIIEMTNATSKTEFAEPLPYTVRQAIPDISKAKERLSWFPVIDLEGGLSRTIDYMKGNKFVHRAGEDMGMEEAALTDNAQK